jgi:hypothetical protein
LSPRQEAGKGMWKRESEKAGKGQAGKGRCMRRKGGKR